MATTTGSKRLLNISSEAMAASNSMTYGGLNVATEQFVSTQVSNLISSAPGALDTLNELAAAIGDDANFATTVTNSIATKLDASVNPLKAASVSNDTITFTRADNTTFAITTSDANTDTNYYLNGITRSGNTLTFSVSGTTNRTYTFGSAAWAATTAFDAAGSASAVNSRIDSEIIPLIDGKADASHTHAYLPLAGGTITGSLTVAGSETRGTYTSLSQYHSGADNIVLKGNASGISSIFFESEKDGTNINHPSDFGFIQYHAYGTSTSGESNELIIGVSNDADDHVILNAPNVNGLKFRTGVSETDYTVYHSGNLSLATLGYTGATNANYITNNNQLTNGAGYVTSSGNTIIGTDSDINTSGSTIIDNIYVTDGVITSMGTRVLTLADLGYTGATNANYITNNNQLTNGAGYLTTTGKAADSNLLDGINSTGFVRYDGRLSANADTVNYTSVKVWDVSTASDAPSGAADGLLTTKYWDSSSWAVQSYHDFHTNRLYLRGKQSGTWQAEWSEVWTTDNFNPASYLTTGGKAADSNLLDGINSTSFLRSDANDTHSGQLALTSITAASGTIANTKGSYLHIGAWGVARTAVDAVLVNTAYRSDILSYTRSFTIGNTARNFNGSANVSWSLADIGAESAGAAAAVNDRIDNDVLPAIPTNNNQLTNGAGYLTTSGKAADSNLLDGLDLHTGRNNQANKVVRTNASGYVDFGWINTTSGNTTSTITDIYVNTNDGYIRKATLAHVKSQLGLGSAAYVATSTFDAAGTGAAEAGAVNSRIDNEVLPAIGAVTLATLGFTGATNANYITNNNQLSNGAGYLTSSNDRVYITDSRGAARAPSYYNDRYAQWDFQNASDTTAGGDSWHALLTVSKWSSYDNSHRQEQLIFTGDNLKRRTATSDSAWGDVKTIWDTGNINPLTNATVSNDTITFTKGDGTTFAITTSDANTWRPIDDTPVNGVTDQSISSNWAYDHVNASNPHGTTAADVGADAAGAADAVNNRIDQEVLPSIPTNNNQLTNGAGYITGFDITTQTDGKYLRSNANDSFSGALTSTARNNGIFGTYDSTKTDHIWSMGTAYKNSSTGADFGNLYGLAYKHTNNTTGGTMAGGHQMVWCSNGTPKSAMGDNVWTGGTVYASGGNSGEWNQAYDNYITGIGVSGTSTKTITLTQRDGGTITTTFSDIDTNTWRGIHDSPVNGATTTSISSNWAFDNVKTAVPANAVFTDTNTQLTDAQVRSKFSAGTNVSISASGVISATDTNTTYSNFGPSTSGLVPGTSGGDGDLFLAGDGTFKFTPDTNTTYTAGAGLDLSGTVFFVESNLAGDVHTIGRDGNDKYVVNTANHAWYLDGALDMLLNNSGTLQVDGDVIAYSTATNSDRRLKKDISTIENASEKVSKLRGVDYTWSHGKLSGKKDIGLIAQEVEEVIPEVVTTGELLDGTEAKNVDYGKLVGLLIESNKEMQNRITELEARLDGLTK